MWIWRSANGELWKDEQLIGHGYSGAPGYQNKPEMEHLKNRGPIPRGRWRLAKPISHPRLGPVCIRMRPIGHDAKGRSAFCIHGDSVKKPGSASEGCIILPRKIRDLIAASGDFDLEVV